MGKIWKNTAILTAITLVAGLLLGAVYEITKEPIRASQERAKQKAYRMVLDSAETFEECEIVGDTKAEKGLRDFAVQGCDISGAAIAKNGAGEEIGYVVTVVSKEGYGGEIEISVGILNDGTVSGIEILSISETAGLGMNAQTPEFRNQFRDVQTEQFELKKDNPSGNIEAISGATITSRAVTNAVNAGLAYFQSVLGGGVDE